MYPGGQGVHPLPDMYCPAGHAGVDDGVTGGRVWERDAAGVRDGLTIASSRSAG